MKHSDTRAETVRAGWDHWEIEAFNRRNLKHNEEWVSRKGGRFKQGTTMVDTDGGEVSATHPMPLNACATVTPHIHHVM